LAVGCTSDRRQAATTKIVIYWLASIGVGLGATGAGKGSARAVTRLYPLEASSPILSRLIVRFYARSRDKGPGSWLTDPLATPVPQVRADCGLPRPARGSRGGLSTVYRLLITHARSGRLERADYCSHSTCRYTASVSRAVFSQVKRAACSSPFSRISSCRFSWMQRAMIAAANCRGSSGSI
jgi:hypothetical protein